MAKMKIFKFPSYLALVYYTCAVWGFSVQPRQDQTACQPVKLDAKANVWKNYSLHINPFYHQLVIDAAERVKDENLKKKALKVADVGSFFWLSVVPFSEEEKKPVPQLIMIGTTSLPFPSLKKRSSPSHATAS